MTLEVQYREALLEYMAAVLEAFVELKQIMLCPCEPQSRSASFESDEGSALQG